LDINYSVEAECYRTNMENIFRTCDKQHSTVKRLVSALINWGTSCLPWWCVLWSMV